MGHDQPSSRRRDRESDEHSAGGGFLLSGIFGSKLGFGTSLDSSGPYADGFVVALDESGASVWAHTLRYSDANHDAPYVVVMGAGLVGLVGEASVGVDTGRALHEFEEGGLGIFRLVLDEAGNPLCSSAYGDVLGLTDVVADEAGHTLLSGAFWESVDFGAGPVGSEPHEGGGFVVRFP